MPRKIGESIAELKNHGFVDHGFVDRGGKSVYRNFKHPSVGLTVTISGNAGDDAKRYQEKAVTEAIAEAAK